MPRTTEPEFGVPDNENPQFTGEQMRKGLRFRDLPAGLQALALAGKKQAVLDNSGATQGTFRLSADVKTALCATGNGWQARANEVLRTHFIESKREGQR